jgi:hypothetical protein
VPVGGQEQRDPPGRQPIAFAYSRAATSNGRGFDGVGDEFRNHQLDSLVNGSETPLPDDLPRMQPGAWHPTRERTQFQPRPKGPACAAGRGPTLRTLLDLYGADQEHQADLVALLRDARQRGWLHAYQSELPEQYTTYIGFEGEARSVWNYESLFIPRPSADRGLRPRRDRCRAARRQA